MSGTDEKNDEGMDAEENETIALSSNELDDILSEAEIVQEKAKKAGNTSEETPEEQDEEFDVPLTEEEFDISGEIDQLTPEDLENIELEESEIESFSKELEEELGEDIALPEGLPDEEAVAISPEKISEELEGIDTGELSFDPEMEGGDIDLESLDSIEGSDIDLESLDSIEGSDIDLGSLEGIDTEEVDLGDLDLGEEIGEQELSEPPVLGEESVYTELETEDAFKEAGIEGVEESVTLADVDLEGIEDITVDDELPSIGEEAGEVMLEDLTEDEFPDIETPEEPIAEESVEELLPDEFIEELPSEETLSEEPIDESGFLSLSDEEPALEAEVTEPVVEELPDDGFAEEILLGEDEETILSEDFDLSAEVEELPEEDVVTISGDEVGTLGEVGSVDAALLNDITTILKFMDTLLGELSDEKIKEFAQSEYFPLYKEVFEKLNLA